MRRKFDYIPEGISFGSNEFRHYFRTRLANGFPNGNWYVTSYLIALVIIIVYLTHMLTAEYAIEFLSIPFYFLLCNFFEYMFHRYPMHNKMRFAEPVYHHVTIHHSFYANDLFYYS